MHIAHIDYNGKIQTCAEHCKNVAAIASVKVKNIGLEKTAYLSGILHDMGKFSNKFDEYINDACNGKKVRKGSVIHTFAGVSYLFQNYLRGKNIDEAFYTNVTIEIISYIIAAHHGLFDCINADGISGFDYRIGKQPEYDKGAEEEFKKECIGEEELEKLFKDAVNEITHVINDVSSLAKTDDETFFYSGLLERLLLSAVIDADRRDTYAFMSGKIMPETFCDWNECLNRLESFLQRKEQKTLIQISRQELSDYCLKFADEPSGIYRLNIPTGSGKTLSGLRYALKHAKKYRKKRIIYVAPLISILEQNAAVIREAIGDDMVLEHHTNVINDSDDGEELEKTQLLTETWDAPVIVTTLVQFLNTLFKGKTSSIRRMAALIDSIIILDEVQSIPHKMLSLFNLAINFLQRVCGASILLCSATQPTFESIPHSMDISEKRILSNEDEHKYYEIFKRCKVLNAGRYKLEDIPNFLSNLFENTNSLLVVCNKKKEAEYLYSILSEIHECYHLSASMCMEHRVDTLNEMIEQLGKRKLICIATQVIEAGVDVSFETVVRFNAGIDNIVQAAGRCNRNGEQKSEAITYIIDCDDETLRGLDDIKRSQDATRELLYDFNLRPEKYDFDLASNKSVIQYYDNLYRELNKQIDYFDYKKNGYPSIFELLSDNAQYLCMAKSSYFINQAFKTAGEIFEPLETNTVTVIVPYKDGINLIESLAGERARYDISYTKELLNQLKRYSVSVMRYQYEWLKKEKAVYDLLDGNVCILMEEYYDKKTGVVTERKEYLCNTLIL